MDVSERRKKLSAEWCSAMSRRDDIQLEITKLKRELENEEKEVERLKVLLESLPFRLR